MKSWMAWKWVLGLLLTGLLSAGCSRRAATSSQETAASSQAQAPVEEVVESEPEPEDVAQMSEPAPQPDISTAAATAMTTPAPIPANVRSTGPLSEVARLAESGVDESVMLAFVTNSTSTFNLRPEEIIFLHDIGVSPAVVTAMIEHDRVLQESASAMTVAAIAPAVPALVPPPQPVEPPPTEMLPQGDYPVEGPPPPAEPESVEESYPAFYGALAPYGSWVNLEGYGACWRPTACVVDAGWRPYFDCGRWVYSDCGWYWLSDYSWGWGPFHYGQWFQHKALGWCWTPGPVWAPAWVCWRYSNRVCGWAPLPPGVAWTAGRGLSFHGQAVAANASLGLAANSFTFVPLAHMPDHHLQRHALGRDQVNQVFNQTVVSTTIVSSGQHIANPGIPRGRVSAAAHTDIQVAAVRDIPAPTLPGRRGERLDANGRSLAVFRPAIPPPHAASPASPGEAASSIGVPVHRDIRPISPQRVSQPEPRFDVPTQERSLASAADARENEPATAGATTLPLPGPVAPQSPHGATPSVNSPGTANGASTSRQRATPGPVFTIGQRQVPQSPAYRPAVVSSSVAAPARRETPLGTPSAGSAPAQSQPAASPPEALNPPANQQSPNAAPRWPEAVQLPWALAERRASEAALAERQQAHQQRPQQVPTYPEQRFNEARNIPGTVAVAPPQAQPVQPAPIEVPRYAPSPIYAREAVRSAPAIESHPAPAMESRAAPAPAPPPAPVSAPAPAAPVSHSSSSERNTR